MEKIAIDKVLVSIMQKRFKSIVEEMSIAITMTTRSPILCEARDFVTGLYDARGKMLEQKENLPILSFSLGPVCEYIIDYYGDDIHPGDVIFHNDVFSMGNQNNDVAVYKPIFHGDVLVGWARPGLVAASIAFFIAAGALLAGRISQPPAEPVTLHEVLALSESGEVPALLLSLNEPDAEAFAAAALMEGAPNADALESVNRGEER